MKRIGIISLFYKSLNYGGTLQSFALCRYLYNHGYDARQIAFDIDRNEAGVSKNLRRVIDRIKDPDTPFFAQLKKYFHIIGCSLKQRIFFRHGFDSRRTAFDEFRSQCIPSTERAYTDATIAECVNRFDAFISGSDIIWNPFLTDSDVFFLSFAPANKPKIAYAASLGVKSLGKSATENYRRRLAIPDAVSTREKSAENILSPLTNKPVQTVLDPTLLLSEGDYSDVTANRIIDTPYIFCYLLGGSKDEKRAAESIACATDLKTVTIHSPGGEYHRKDNQFGDIQINNAGPREFLSLIKNADIVLTDSFHAIAFSVIFRKRFLALKRHNDSDPMSLNSRLSDFLTMLGISERIIYPREYESGIELSNADVDYDSVYKRLDELKESSEQFLKNSLADNSASQ